MEQNTKASKAQIIAIIILSVLLVVSLALGASFAWFANQNGADATMTMGGKIIIRLENSEAKSASFVNKTALLPGTKIESDVNVMISESNTPCFLRAKIDITVEPKTDITLSEGTKRLIIDTFNDGIQKMIDDTGTLFLQSSDLTGGEHYGNIIDKGARWILYDGWFYLVSVDQDLEATTPEAIQLLNIYTGNASLLLKFVVGNFYLPGVEWGNELKDCDLTFDITAQAVQIFQTKKPGEERPTYHNETLDEALVVFGEALEPSIVFYANGGDGNLPLSILPTEDNPVGSFVTLPTPDLTKDGKPFKCWNTREDGNGTNYNGGDTIKLTPARKKLYAIYEE